MSSMKYNWFSQKQHYISHTSATLYSCRILQCPLLKIKPNKYHFIANYQFSIGLALEVFKVA